MKTLHKTFDARFKALTDQAPGTFEAVVAAFDNVDRVGDRIKSTAFDATLKMLADSGDPLPIIFSHQWGDAMAIIGKADAADIRAVPGRGLVLKGQILNMESNPLARQVYNLMEQRLLKEFSIGYTVPQGGEMRAKDGANDLTAIDLIEAGPCLKGVNPATELLAVKAMREAGVLTPEPSAVETLKAERLLAAKAYVDFDPEDGSFQDTIEDVQEALEAAYPAPSADVWVCVQQLSTTDTRVQYQVSMSGPGAPDEDDEGSPVGVWQADYHLDDATDTVVLGDPVAMEVVIVADSPAEDAADLAEEEANGPNGKDVQGADNLIQPEIVDPNKKPRKAEDAPEIERSISDQVAELTLKATLDRQALSAERSAWLDAAVADDQIKQRLAELTKDSD